MTGALIPTLGFGIPWNQGLLRPVRVTAPDGLICTAQHPAPVGSATVETIWVVTNVVCRALNLLLAATPEFAHRAQAVSSGTMATFNLGGVNQFGERFGLHLLDPLAGGSGAFASRDGIDAGGPPAVPVPGIADVERNEQVSPLRYLHRRLRIDSGGAGLHRGGRSAEVALTVHGIDHAEALIMTHGAEVPNSQGLLGGLPGSMVDQRFGHGAISDPEGSRWEHLGPKPGRRVLSDEDVFAVVWQGGGGWGDPLLRPPAAVASDVEEGAVSLEAARAVYGVEPHGSDVDTAATDLRRNTLRAERLGRSEVQSSDVPADLPPGARWLGPSLLLVPTAHGWQVRSRAGALLSEGTTNWRRGAISRTVPFTGLHEGLEVTHRYCPTSGDLLAVDVHEPGREPWDEVDLDLPPVAQDVGDHDAYA